MRRPRPPRGCRAIWRSTIMLLWWLIKSNRQDYLVWSTVYISFFPHWRRAPTPPRASLLYFVSSYDLEWSSWKTNFFRVKCYSVLWRAPLHAKHWLFYPQISSKFSFRYFILHHPHVIFLLNCFWKTCFSSYTYWSDTHNNLFCQPFSPFMVSDMLRLQKLN
jgi:hypothetical protein